MKIFYLSSFWDTNTEYFVDNENNKLYCIFLSKFYPKVKISKRNSSSNLTLSLKRIS